MKYEWNVTGINRNARPNNNNQLITYYLHVRYLLRIQQYPLNTTYNIENAWKHSRFLTTNQVDRKKWSISLVKQWHNYFCLEANFYFYIKVKNQLENMNESTVLLNFE